MESMANIDSARDFEIVIAAPLPEVWHVLAERFDHIGEWASGIPRSWAAEVAGADTAPVPGRVCANTLPGFDDVTETIIDYSEDPHSFTYRGSGMPAWLGVATNTWHAQAIDEATTRVYFEPEVQSAGLLGRLVLPLFMPVLRRLATHILDDLKAYLETGQPSARKQKQSQTQ